MFTLLSNGIEYFITVEGFSTLGNIKVKLYTVNLNGVRSEPVEVEISPLEAPIHLIKKSLKMVTDFSGISAIWENTTGTEIGVKLLATDDNQVLKESQSYYSYVVNEEHTFNGFDDTERTFAIYFEDKWGNVSDTSFLKTTPYFESEVKKPFIQITYIPKDNNTSLNTTYPFKKMYDGLKGYDNAYISVNGSVGNSFTLDLQKQIKLSRVILWHRWQGVNYSQILGTINILSFEMWGIDKIDNTKLTDLEYWADETSGKSFKDDWVYLGKYNIVQPDAGQGSQIDANLAAGIAGFPFRAPIIANPVRYIRFFARSTGVSFGGPPTSNYYEISELSFYGNDKIPQY